MVGSSQMTNQPTPKASAGERARNAQAVPISTTHGAATPSRAAEKPARRGFPTRTAVATWGLGVGAMWFWHAPRLCNAAASSPDVQYLQTLSLLLMGGAFWWPILSPRVERRLPPFAAMLYLFTACLACTTLGILITFSPIEVCSIFAHPVDHLGALPLLRGSWGLDAQADQQIGGLLMWVPACLIYAIGIMASLGRYYAEEPARRPPPDQVIAPDAQEPGAAEVR